jgi:hypothetical protein
VHRHCIVAAAGIAGAVVLPVAGVVGGAVQVGRGIANQSEATQEKKKGRIWNKVCRWLEGPTVSADVAVKNG